MNIVTLFDKSSHDAAVKEAEDGIPTVIYVSFEPAPVCRAFTPEFQRVAGKETDSRIRYYQMEYGKDTSALMKFGPQHMPIVVFMEGAKCQMLLQPRIEEVESTIESFFGHQ